MNKEPFSVRLALLFGATLLGAALTGTALAFDDEATCMASVPVTPSLVRDASMFDLVGFAAEGAEPAFVAGWLSPTRDAQDDASGSVVFVRAADGDWRAFLPFPGEGIVSVYAAPETGAIIIATMWGTEAPGGSWTLMRSTRDLANGACVTVDFPDTLNKPWANEFLVLADLDIAANGRGEIIGVARTENRGDLWYAYPTRDGGATWSTPRRLLREREAHSGLYSKLIESRAPEALVADLARFAEGR